MTQNSIRQKRLLLVDDEQALRDMVSSFLKEGGFGNIRAVGTVSEAITTARDWQPELVLLDVMLPDGDGFTLFEALRRFTDVPDRARRGCGQAARAGTRRGRLHGQAVSAAGAAFACRQYFAAVL